MVTIELYWGESEQAHTGSNRWTLDRHIIENLKKTRHGKYVTKLGKFTVTSTELVSAHGTSCNV